MKSNVFYGIKDIRLEERDLPQCGDDAVILKTLAAGVCGSDVVAYLHGNDTTPPGSLWGHELVGSIIEKGKNVTDFEVGDRVYPYSFTCMDEPTSNLGGFSEYTRIAHCKKDYSLFHIDDSITDNEAALLEPLTVGFHAAKRFDVKKNEKVVVFGAGIIGLSAALYLKSKGVEQVIVVDISDLRLEAAKKIGCDTCNSVNEDLKQILNARYGTASSLFGVAPDVDVFIDATGLKAILDTFQELGKTGAKLSIVGVHHELRPFDFSGVTFNEWMITGSCGYDHSDVKDALELLKSKKYDVEGFISHQFPLEQMEEAVLTSANSKESVKVIIKYE